MQTGIKYFLYFLTGGTIVSIVTYLASHAKGLLAAFFANLPIVTFITFLTIYYESGQRAIVSYAEGLIIMLFPWLAYIFAIIFLTQRLGFIPSIIIGISLYLLLAYLIINVKNLL
ncbi:MAG: DUF3147 domain-containing protein [Nitrospirota bacterium]